jgi:hypothetical protein
LCPPRQHATDDRTGSGPGGLSKAIRDDRFFTCEEPAFLFSQNLARRGWRMASL